MIDIKGYEGHYAITREGEVWSYKSGRWMKPHKSVNGYYTITFCVNGITSRYLLHRLVLSTFSSSLNTSYEVNHIDGNKLNHHLGNLEWTTTKENAHHAHSTGLCNHSIHLASLTLDDVKYIRAHKEMTSRQLADKFSVTTKSIRNVWSRRTWKNI